VTGALEAARDAAVVCDLGALSVIAIDGPDATAFLQGQLSNDVSALREETWQLSSHNSPKGRMLVNFALWREPGPRYLALMSADLADGARKRLGLYVLRAKVTLRDASADSVKLGIGGPRAEAALRTALGTAPPVFGVARAVGATILGLPGLRYCVIAAPDRAAAIRDALQDSATPAPFAVWQWLTIRAGIPVLTAATQDLFVAQMANLDVLGGVDFRKGCYTGQEIIARMQYLGRLKERLFVFHAEAGAVLPGTRLYSNAFPGQPCGTVVNAAPAPDGGCDLTAVLQIAAAEAGDVRLDAADGDVLVPLTLPYAVPVPASPPGRGAEPRGAA
jgi:folate-binding protein YgfZ